MFSTSRKLATTLTAISCIAVLTSCAHIELQPKDPQLQSLEKFADDVTIHLTDTSPDTYVQYQGLLTDEIAPGVLNQLKERGWCAKSAEEAKTKAKTLETCTVQIKATDFPSKATESGLVPVEVTGTINKVQAGPKDKQRKFHIIYLVGNNRVTHKPIVASIQIR